MCLIINLLLYGCDVEQESINKQIKHIIDKEHYSLPDIVDNLEPEMPQESEDVLSSEEFPNPKGYLDTAQANKLQEMRSYNFRKQKVSVSYDVENSIQQESKYDLPVNISTTPVNRDRILTADMYIPCILSSNINSEVAGKITLIVDQDVLSPTMQYILLPSYTKIICEYNGLQNNGDNRLEVTCSRIIRPDGVNINLSKAQAADIIGGNGLHGEVDDKKFDKYLAVFMMSTMTALPGLVNQDKYSKKYLHEVLHKTGMLTYKIFEDELNIKPVMLINSGTKVMLKPAVDILFKSVV